MISQEYIASIILILGAILKGFGVEIESKTLEAIISGALALWIAIRRFQKKDITVLGMKK